MITYDKYETTLQRLAISDVAYARYALVLARRTAKIRERASERTAYVSSG